MKDALWLLWLPLWGGCGDDAAAPGSQAGATTAGTAIAGAATAGTATAGTATAGSSAGTGSVDAGTDSGNPTASDLPEPTAEAIGAFVAAERYREAPWISQTDAPREPQSVSPHDRVRVWLNATLVASFGAGNGADLDSTPHDTGSMAVKEFYDGDGTRLGWAAMLKLEGDRRQWAYYCDGPEGRCDNNGPPPIFAIASGPSCTFCHSGLIFTHPP